MLHKIVLGTANFVKPYGILSNNSALGSVEINLIMNYASQYNINTYDTAFAYGDFFSVMPTQVKLNELKLITKFSVLENFQDIKDTIQRARDLYHFENYYGVLIHDAANLHQIDTNKLLDFFECLRSKYHVQKVGVSLYEPKDLSKFDSFFVPDIIQVPLNPLNQVFCNTDFFNYVSAHNIEVHARSLFLQGVLLSDELPDSLKELKPIWKKFQQAVNPYQSRLQALLSWASKQEWVSNWVFGVAALSNLIEIVDTLKNMENTKNMNSASVFEEFTHFNNSMVDPRTWCLK
jgi:aryl-alcohol dehydrogenase-like predicted oxidoreductase